MLGDAQTPKTSQPIPIFQLVTRDHPPSRDDVRPVSAELAQRRGPAV